MYIEDNPLLGLLRNYLFVLGCTRDPPTSLPVHQVLSPLMPSLPLYSCLLPACPMRLSAPVTLLAGLGTVSALTITHKGVELNSVSRLTDSSCQRYSEGFYSTWKRNVTISC